MTAAGLQASCDLTQEEPGKPTFAWLLTSIWHCSLDGAFARVVLVGILEPRRLQHAGRQRRAACQQPARPLQKTL